jgi:hypothetical protein
MMDQIELRDDFVAIWMENSQVIDYILKVAISRMLTIVFLFIVVCIVFLCKAGTSIVF